MLGHRAPEAPWPSQLIASVSRTEKDRAGKAALFILFDRIVDGTRTVTPRERRDQLLYWCAVIVIGVLIWLLTEWVVPLQ